MLNIADCRSNCGLHYGISVENSRGHVFISRFLWHKLIFIDDLLVKVPPLKSTQTHADAGAGQVGASPSASERYMTKAEFTFFAVASKAKAFALVELLWARN